MFAMAEELCLCHSWKTVGMKVYVIQQAEEEDSEAEAMDNGQ